LGIPNPELCVISRISRGYPLYVAGRNKISGTR